MIHRLVLARPRAHSRGMFTILCIYRTVMFWLAIAFDFVLPQIASCRGSFVFSFYASAFRRRRHYVFGLSVRPSVRPSEAWNTLFWHVHGSVGPPDQPLPFYGMSVRPSVRPSVCPSVRLSVRPSGEVSGHLPENAWREWPEILHADVSWPSSQLISLWPRPVYFSNFGAILT